MSSGSPDARLVETHVSVLVMLGERVYKVKKPVRLDFVDLTTREERERVCRREVELNRRLAPNVYLGVADVVGPHGELCDHLVVMARMPDERRLSTLVRAGAPVDGALREIARVVAAFHARAATSPEIARAGSIDAVRERWEANIEGMQPFVGSVLDAEAAERVALLARRYLAGRERLFAARVSSGKVRDGHGDLLADDVFCLDDGPRILDCLEFNDALRYGDVLADVAFLAMDLERIGAPGLARRFLSWYRELAAETFPATLADHYVAYRAHVRAKVACLRHAQSGADADAVDAASLLGIAARHLTHGQVTLVLVGGLPGTGKSTLATGVADRFGWSLLRSDEVRKDVAGLAHDARTTAAFGRGLYDDDATSATYHELLTRAEVLLEHGEPVVLDASWTDPERRDDAAALAARTDSELLELRCEAPLDVATARIAARAQAGADASDATVAVLEEMAQHAAPWPSAAPVDTARDPEGSFERAIAIVSARLERTAQGSRCRSSG